MVVQYVVREADRMLCVVRCTIEGSLECVQYVVCFIASECMNRVVELKRGAVWWGCAIGHSVGRQSSVCGIEVTGLSQLGAIWC